MFHHYQYFCGEEFFQHRLPVEPSSLSIFRKRIGAKGEERIFQETLKLGLKTGAVTTRDLKKSECRYDGSGEDCTFSNEHAAIPQGTHGTY
ncbi:MAG: transposase [Alphaproteobacteria bacterium]|nr:transposase [Alphaproteobacteria bacterium]